MIRTVGVVNAPDLYLPTSSAFQLSEFFLHTPPPSDTTNRTGKLRRLLPTEILRQIQFCSLTNSLVLVWLRYSTSSSAFSGTAIGTLARSRSKPKKKSAAR